MLKHLISDIFSHLTKRSSQIRYQVGFVSGAQNIPKGLRLRIMGVWMRILTSLETSLNSRCTWCPLWLLIFSTFKTRLVIYSTPKIGVSTNAISLTMIECCPIRTIDGYLCIISAKSMSMGIWIREEPTLKHFISRCFNPWHEMAWRESRLLHFCMVIHGIPI